MRLIDADNIKYTRLLSQQGLDMELVAKVAIDNMPTVYAEAVVRCNTCKHYETDTGFCNYHDHGMRWDDYCSRGTKMEQEG